MRRKKVFIFSYMCSHSELNNKHRGSIIGNNVLVKDKSMNDSGIKILSLQ